MTHFVFILAQ